VGTEPAEALTEVLVNNSNQSEFDNFKEATHQLNFNVCYFQGLGVANAEYLKQKRNKKIQGCRKIAKMSGLSLRRKS